MKVTKRYNGKPLQQKFWLKELELIADDNDFLLSMLANLQNEHVITHKYDDRTSIFFNHFQYFFHQVQHLKQSLEEIEGQELKNIRLKEDIDCLMNKFEVFKTNFKNFLSSLEVHKPVLSYY